MPHSTMSILPWAIAGITSLDAILVRRHVRIQAETIAQQTLGLKALSEISQTLVYDASPEAIANLQDTVKYWAVLLGRPLTDGGAES